MLSPSLIRDAHICLFDVCNVYDDLELTMPPPVGLIITVSIIVAASLAAYENPQVRAWIDRTRLKVASGLYSLGDEVQPRRPRPLRSSTDVSMSEDKGDAAEARRQRARNEIMERSRILEDRRKRRKMSGDVTPTSPSFDTLVDEQGRLISDLEAQKGSSAVEVTEQAGTLRSRHQIPIDTAVHDSVDATIPLRQLPSRPDNATHLRDVFESRYEQEMRHTWNLPLPDRDATVLSSHASESLIDLTPTTEDFPDPDYSIPDLQQPNQSGYSSAAASRPSSHTLSDGEPEFYYAHPSQPMVPLEPRRQVDQSQINFSVSSAPSVAGSTHHIQSNEAEMSEDDLLSEPDGIQTPASAWTEVGSTVSADA